MKVGEFRLQGHRTTWVLHATVEYARQFENPVIVLEDLSYIREHLDYGTWMNRRLHDWAFARPQGRIEDKALEAGIPVRFVNPAYTSQTCHACGHPGSRSSQAAFRCTNDECWVSEYQADIDAVARLRLAGSQQSAISGHGGQYRWSPRPVGRERSLETGAR